jgi:hypothetical protein
MSSNGEPALSTDAVLMRSLERAIVSTPSKQLRELLVELVHTNIAASALVKSRLLPYDSAVPGPTATTQKYLETCKNCQILFTIAENQAKACNYHTGWLNTRAYLFRYLH